MGGVLPFLVFFMLVTKDQMDVRLVNMFESRIDVPKFVSSLGNMIRGFVLGNLIIGSIMAAGTSVVFLVLVVGIVCLVGMAIIHGVTATRQKDPPSN